MKSIDKLREWSCWLDGAYATEEGGHYHAYNYPLTSSMKSCGELMREKCDEIEAEIADNYMRLPVDADGVPIHVGDAVAAQDEQPFKVRAFQLDALGWFAIERLGSQWNVNQLHHVKPRTLEDVLREYGKAYYAHMADNYMNYDGTDKQVVEKYADEIRELLGGDAE